MEGKICYSGRERRLNTGVRNARISCMKRVKVKIRRSGKTYTGRRPSTRGTDLITARRPLEIRIRWVVVYHCKLCKRIEQYRRTRCYDEDKCRCG